MGGIQKHALHSTRKHNKTTVMFILQYLKLRICLPNFLFHRVVDVSSYERRMQVITETIRLANPAALLWRETKEDVQLNGNLLLFT